MPNIVYALTNPAMPRLVKIGMTDRPDVQDRMRDLYTTGTPLPFDCVIAWELEGPTAADVEQALHTAFAPHRINPSREFFELEDPEQVVALVRLLPGRDVTPSDVEQSSAVEPADQVAAVEFKRRQSRTNETEFLEARTAHGRVVYERVLTLAQQDGLAVRWGRVAFTLYDLASGAVVCRGWPDDISTDFGSLRERAKVPQEALDALVAAAEQTNLFRQIGSKRLTLSCLTDREWDEPALAMLTGWLQSVIEQAREYTAGTASE